MFVRLYNLAQKWSIVYQFDYKITHSIITIAFIMAKKYTHGDLKAYLLLTTAVFLRNVLFITSLGRWLAHIAFPNAL